MYTSESAERYGSALFKTCISDDEILSTQIELSNAYFLQKEHPLFSKVLLCPQIPLSQKKTLLSKIFSLKLALFFLLLLQRGKFNTLAEINHVYNQLTDVKFNQKRALCVSAHKMEPLQKEKIRKLLESSFGKTILLDEKVTPAIIGGFVLFVNNTMLDASVQGKLNGMKKNL